MSDAWLSNEMGVYASIRLNPPRLEGVKGKSITEGYVHELTEREERKRVSLNKRREE